MPEYLAPGVFIEETSFRAKSIEGVGTSVASVVGPTRTGPLRGVPEVVTSYAEFERVFGDAEDLQQILDATVPDPTTTAVSNYTAHAARAFFDNGGKQLFVARVVQGVNASVAAGTGSSAGVAGTDVAQAVRFNARFPGAAGDFAIELLWSDSENLLTTTTLNTVEEGEVVFIDANNVAAADTNLAPADATFPAHIRAAVQRTGADYLVLGTAEVLDAADDSLNPPGNPLTSMVAANLNPAETTITRVAARRPAGGVLADQTPAVLTLRNAIDISTFGVNLEGETSLNGLLDAAGTTFTVVVAENPALAAVADFDVPLAALGQELPEIRSIVIRKFALDVHKGNADGEVIWSIGDIMVPPGTARSLDTLLPAMPERRIDQLTQPISCNIVANTTGTGVTAALAALYDQALLNPPDDALDDPRRVIMLTGGTDGVVPGAVDYAGEADETNGPTGFRALEGVEDIAICMVPAAAEHADTHVAVTMEMQKHCRRMRYRVGIVDSRRDMSLGEVREFRNNFDDSRLALYYPWVVMANPTGATLELAVPPAGFIAGIYANTDVTRGVHKAPANEPVIGALRFNQTINKFQQELLNPYGINCLRSFPGRGHRVWGGRTLSSDPEWRYVNVRRYFNYLERSIEKSTQWAVFEPNGEALWANIRSAVEDFLFNEWSNRRLLGGKPREAYFVRCDRSTMTQNDIDNGRMICIVGVAALRPAEFVIFRIGQKTADA